ncbi:serine-rich adhesin for platelets isoform X2 [Drosophila nasuta]|uniref:serine-rich adhesin for platelets isoform X2 n=1 Tax=Drosophila nasuta TaxID=42062 RepID=UPI00295F2FEA|nr:serine-rich adhesin for platelets isoform X2 [Drosophila nasuta]
MDKTICAIVEYEYAAKEPDELDLQKGAIIHRIKQMPGGWWQGTLKANGVTGMFPDNFVRVLEPSSNGNHSDDSAAVQLREKSATSNRRCKVIYSYTQVNDDELTLAVGDVIEFLGEVEEGWWRGRLRSKVGVFPSNFVQHIEPSPILASKRPPTIGATVTTSALTAKASNIATATTPAAAAAATTTTTAATAAPAAVAATTTKQQTKSRVTASTVDATTAAAAAAAAAAATAAVPTLPPKPQRDYCRVEFPYAPQNDDELELKVDDIISVISMELPDKGWWKGELRGKVGVFPDNFVKLLAPSDVAPINEPAAVTTQQQSQRKISNTSHMTTTNANNSSSSSSTTTTVTQQQQQQQQQQSSASTTSKVYIKKTSNNSSSSSTSAGRKESFGSRDSLNDILSETGLPIGTVAAQRKSLENKNLDLSKLPGSKQSSNTTSTATTITTATSATTNNTSTYAELRKSLDNMDEKIKSPPPPVLGKKPSVPLKKTPTGNVTGHILSGGIKKKSGADSKLTSAMSHDVSDGLAGSKLIGGQLPDAGVAGNVVMRRAATIAVEDTDFDRVERGSILQDMRAGRVKAPKRRPPSAAINVLGESNNNSVYVNGSGMASSASELSEDGGQGKQATASSDDNSTGEEPQLVKPKPRDWEKQKAPWMEELKASQVGRKKTSPNVEPRGGAVSVAERTSKLFASEQVTATSSVLTTSATSSTTNNTTTSSSSSTSNATTATRVQSSAVTSSSIMQQSMIVESSSSSSSQRKESNSSSSSSQIISTSNSNHNDAIMSKSMSAAKLTNPTAAAAPTPASAAASSDEESRVVRPNSLSIRNRSVSPLVKTTNEKSNNLSAHDGSTQMQNNHHQAAAGAGAESTPRVQQLEGRVDKLEAMVLTQQRTIEELVRTLREETERVKVLRGELDKYAQCVTQV